MNPLRKAPRLWQLTALPYLLFLLIPLAALLLRSDSQQVALALRQPQVGMAVRLSLLTATASMLLTLLFGTPVAYLLAQRSTRLRSLLDTLVDLPTVLPPSVAGVALLVAFGRGGLLGSSLAALGISLPFTTAAVIMAQTFVAAPLFIKSAAVGLSAIDPELRQAAAIDGANRWQVFRYVTLPLAWLAFLSGSAMTWARALGEFGATILFAGNFPGRTQTMPLAIYIGFEVDLRVALALSTILIFLSFLIIVLVKGLLRLSLRRSGPYPAEQRS